MKDFNKSLATDLTITQSKDFRLFNKTIDDTMFVSQIIKCVKQMLLTLLFSLFTLSIQAHELSINLTESGTLGSVIQAEDNGYIDITDLTISGPMNAKDFGWIKRTIRTLWYLDISNVTIESVSTILGTDYGTSRTYPANEIPTLAFENSVLVSIKLPTSLKSIGEKAFNVCRELTSIDLENTKIETLTKFSITNSHEIENLTMPETLRQVNYRALAGVTLNTLTLNSELELIKSGAFYTCYLQKIVISKAISVEITTELPFEDGTEGSNTLEIIANSEDILAHSYWSTFATIINNDITTDVHTVKYEEKAEIKAIYDMNGNSMSIDLNQLPCGTYIIVYSDGRKEKVCIQN